MKIAFISDIHEDILSLKKTLKLIEKFKCDEIACLGDIVGYSVNYYKHLNTRNANECIRLISENVKYSVAGNHDHYAIKKIPSFVNDFYYQDNWYDLSFERRKELANGKIWLYEDEELSPLLNDFSLEWLSKLPEKLYIDIASKKIHISHYIYPDITGAKKSNMHSVNDIKEHHSYCIHENVNMSIFGHVHSVRMLLADNINLKNKKFFCVSNALINVGLPPIVNNRFYSGFIIYDSINNNIETVSIKSKFL